MRFFPRSFWTITLSGLLGASVGMWNRPALLTAEAAVGQTPPMQPVKVTVGKGIHKTPPPFVSVAASLEWVLQSMDEGDALAAQALFRKDAGLTDEQRCELAVQLVERFRRMDPHVLAPLILSLPRGAAADEALWKLVRAWSGYDSEGLLRFLEALPEDRMNNVMLSSAAFGLARLPAERVAEFASRLSKVGRGYLIDGLIESANQAGSWRNTSAMLSQMSAQGDGGGGATDWRMGVTLAEIAPEEVEKGIEAEKDPVKRDQLLAGLAWDVGHRDPKSGIALDSRLEMNDQREDHLERHTSAWLESDRSAALAWLRGSESSQILSREMRAKFLKIYGLEAAP